MFENIYQNKKVLITGHTGFKGSWLCLWLENLGAEVCGYALPPDTRPAHFSLLQPFIRSEIGDIRDLKKISQVMEAFQPEIVFHLAAQPLVRRSYANPLETFHTNVLGTANILEACRNTPVVKAVLVITSDKCYENKEWVWGYRENDPMGGHDPYSASKGCAELLVNSYRRSFFHKSNSEKLSDTLIATARAGNVIGGGDWGEDRLIPDIMRAIEAQKPLIIRNPGATRPWQHVLEPLSGYLHLGQKLLQGKAKCASAWNFGPSVDEHLTVFQIAEQIKSVWNVFSFNIESKKEQPHEANLLKLDCSKARTELSWSSVWQANKALHKTIEWYKHFYTKGTSMALTQIQEYVKDAAEKKLHGPAEKGVTWTD